MPTTAGGRRSGRSEAGTARSPAAPVHDDLCAVTDEKGRTRHEFNATALNELWIGDITEHWTGEGKLYLCAFKDVYSNRIVAYSIESRMKSLLAVTALNNADPSDLDLGRGRPPGRSSVRVEPNRGKPRLAR